MKQDLESIIKPIRNKHETHMCPYCGANYIPIISNPFTTCKTCGKLLYKEPLDIGDEVKYYGTELGVITHIRKGDHEDPTKYRVRDSKTGLLHYVNENSLAKRR